MARCESIGTKLLYCTYINLHKLEEKKIDERKFYIYYENENYIIQLRRRLNKEQFHAWRDHVHSVAKTRELPVVKWAAAHGE